MLYHSRLYCSIVVIAYHIFTNNIIAAHIPINANMYFLYFGSLVLIIIQYTKKNKNFWEVEKIILDHQIGSVEFFPKVCYEF